MCTASEGLYDAGRIHRGAGIGRAVRSGKGARVRRNTGVQHTEELPGDHFTSHPQAFANPLTFVLSNLGMQEAAIVYDDTQHPKHVACRQALRNNWDDDEEDSHSQ